ncbi:MAG: NAD(P)H-hydrate dehydratase [Clostridia bacterium]|nr:NAD(P)H-hydrate dehydratase [Clostridia bacterium]
MYLVTPEQMKRIEAYCFHTLMIPSLLLMEQAGSQVAEYVVRHFKMENHVLVLCGKGNNGGDGFVIARKLIDYGYKVEVILLGKKEVLKGDAATCCRYLEHFIKIHEILDYDDYIKVKSKKNYHLIIDSLLGTGLNKPIDGLMKNIIEDLNTYDAYKISVDIATGVSGLTGEIMSSCLDSDLTIAFGSYKRGHILYPGKSRSKLIIVKPIGIPEEAFQSNDKDYVINKTLIQKMERKRRTDGHKGSFGKGLLIAGSPGMEGALILASQGALKSGLGLLYALTAPAINTVFKVKVPEAVSLLYSSDFFSEQTTLIESIAEYKSVLIGPGLGENNRTKQYLDYFLAQSLPVVIDADGLNVLAKHMNLLEHKKCEVVMTPHLGEMSRLTGLKIESIQKDLIEVARHYAQIWKVVLVLKSATTIVASPEGQVYGNLFGNSGMATAGSGDVLAGIIMGLQAQGYSGLESSLMGVYKHSKAGDAAAKEKGEAAMLASDLLNYLL